MIKKFNEYLNERIFNKTNQEEIISDIIKNFNKIQYLKKYIGVIDRYCIDFIYNDVNFTISYIWKNYPKKHKKYALSFDINNNIEQTDYINNLETEAEIYSTSGSYGVINGYNLKKLYKLLDEYEEKHPVKIRAKKFGF